MLYRNKEERTRGKHVLGVQKVGRTERVRKKG